MMSGALKLRRPLLHRIAAGGGTGNGPDDEFVWGSSIDTAGARYFGAYPWTIQNQRTGTITVSAGKLTMACVHSASTMDPIIVTEAMDAGDGIWRCIEAMSVAFPSNWQGAGLVLRESATGKMLCHGFACDNAVRLQVRQLTAYNNWIGNYGNHSATGIPYTLEIIRDGSLLIFLYSANGTDWTELARATQTTDFTTGPDQIGLWVNTANAGSATLSADFDYFRKVTRTVPYNVPIVNPGAEFAIAAPWTNVTGTLGTRAIVPHSGSNVFKINGNPGAFEVYQEWSATHFATLFDAGGRTATFSGWGNPWTGATTTYRLRLDAYDAGGSSLGNATTSYWTPTGSYSQKSAVLSVPTGTRKLRMTIEGTTSASDDGWWDDLTLVIT